MIYSSRRDRDRTPVESVFFGDRGWIAWIREQATDAATRTRHYFETSLTIPVAAYAVIFRTESTSSVPADLPASTPTWRDVIDARITHLRALPPDWDAEGAEPVSEDAIDGVVRLLEENMSPGSPVPFIAPGADGSLQVEWSDLPDGALEIGVGPRAEIEALLVERASGRERMGGLQDLPKSLAELLAPTG